jgi:hypothetical protein
MWSTNHVVNKRSEMPTTVLTELPAEAAQMYDGLNQEIGISQGNTPTGLIHHFATTTGTGFVIFEVWETKEQFDRFSKERLEPAIDKVSGGQAPDASPTFGELYNEFHG